jgi:hypothetical protein
MPPTPGWLRPGSRGSTPHATPQQKQATAHTQAPKTQEAAQLPASCPSDPTPSHRPQCRRKHAAPPGDAS